MLQLFPRTEFQRAVQTTTVLVITEGKRHEITVAKRLTFPAGTIVVFDRGYIDYGWLAQLDAAGVFFVTRAKRNVDYEVVEAPAAA